MTGEGQATLYFTGCRNKSGMTGEGQATLYFTGCRNKSGMTGEGQATLYLLDAGTSMPLHAVGRGPA